VASIKREHAQYITDHACAQLRWLNRLCERLQAHRVPPDDPLMRAATQAYNAMHALRVHSMYAAIEHGVCELPQVEDG